MASCLVHVNAPALDVEALEAQVDGIGIDLRPNKLGCDSLGLAWQQGEVIVSEQAGVDQTIVLAPADLSGTGLQKEESRVVNEGRCSNRRKAHHRHTPRPTSSLTKKATQDALGHWTSMKT